MFLCIFFSSTYHSLIEFFRALNESLTASVPGSSHLAIIVQTNFQLCAYTTSELHVSMLSLFCDETQFRRLPNIVFFKITRDSIKSAFRLGIGSGQVRRLNFNTGIIIILIQFNIFVLDITIFEDECTSKVEKRWATPSIKY